MGRYFNLWRLLLILLSGLDNKILNNARAGFSLEEAFVLLEVELPSVVRLEVDHDFLLGVASALATLWGAASSMKRRTRCSGA